jgi:hypothetical protein
MRELTMPLGLPGPFANRPGQTTDFASPETSSARIDQIVELLARRIDTSRPPGGDAPPQYQSPTQ